MSKYSVDANGRLLENVTIGDKTYKKGMFPPGVSGNKKGRPRKKPIEQLEDKGSKINKELLAGMLDEAEGDPYEFLKLVLKNGSELGLDLATCFKLSKELLPYEKPKKASIETKVEEFRRIEFHMVMPETYNQLDAIYKKKPELIEALPEDKLIDVTSGKVEPELVIEAVNYAVKPENDDSNT